MYSKIVTKCPFKLLMKGTTICQDFAIPYLFQIRNKFLQRRQRRLGDWNEVLNRVAPDAIEAGWVKGLIPLPVDHRYGIDEMEKIVRVIRE